MSHCRDSLFTSPSPVPPSLAHHGRLFWGHPGISVKPNVSLSGLANLAALTAALADSAAGADLDGVLALEQVCVNTTLSIT